MSAAVQTPLQNSSHGWELRWSLVGSYYFFSSSFLDSWSMILMHGGHQEGGGVDAVPQIVH